MTIQEIELHVGHFGDGTGARGLVDEVAEARKVTQRVYEILKSIKIPATYFEDSASKNQTDNINALIKHHNQDRNGLVVSIHFNASRGDSNQAIGTEVLYYNQKELAARLAKSISDATGGGLKNRGAKQRTDLGVLAKTYEPAILIEVCFVNSAIDVAIYRRDFERICQAIAAELAKVVQGSNAPGKQIYEIVGDENSKVWRIQSGKFTSKDAAVKAFEKSGLSYATIKGTKE